MKLIDLMLRNDYTNIMITTDINSCNCFDISATNHVAPFSINPILKTNIIRWKRSNYLPN